MLTPAALAVCVWGAVAGSAPAAAAAGTLAAAAYAAWRLRGNRWHDVVAILLLLPALGCALWLTAVHTAPGVGLTGILCALLGYQGRHAA